MKDLLLILSIISFFILLGIILNCMYKYSYAHYFGEINMDSLDPGKITTIITTAPQPSIPSPKFIIDTLKSVKISPSLHEKSYYNWIRRL